MTPEGKVKKDIRTFLDAMQANGELRYFMPQNMGMGESGVADFIGVYKGRGFAIEAKRAEIAGPNLEHATPWQWRFLQEWRAASGLAGVARSDMDAMNILRMQHPNDRPIDVTQPDRKE